MTREPGCLQLVATPIGNLGDMTLRAIDTLRNADRIVAEDTRQTRKLLTHFDIPGGNRLMAVHEHNERERSSDIVAAILNGERVAYVTDAGTPGVSDPGEVLVAACVAAGCRVEAIPGASAALAALITSGLPTARFVFEGFLPRRGRERHERIADIAREQRTTICFESPHRVAATLAELATACGPDRQISLARELTKHFEEIWRGTIADAMTFVAEHPPRGEYVIVIAPAPVVAHDVSDDDIRDALARELASGASVRDAAATVSVSVGVAKRRAYDLAIALKSE